MNSFTYGAFWLTFFMLIITS